MTEFDSISPDIDLDLGKIEDAGVVVEGGRIDRHWDMTGIKTNIEHMFDDFPRHDWLFDSEKARQHFDLRSIEFGNWMNQEDRANFLYASMLSLHNLAKLFRIKDVQIGFGGDIIG